MLAQVRLANCGGTEAVVGVQFIERAARGCCGQRAEQPTGSGATADGQPKQFTLNLPWEITRGGNSKDFAQPSQSALIVFRKARLLTVGEGA